MPFFFTTKIQLSSKSDVERFSINAAADVRFVTISMDDKTSRRNINCHSTECRRTKNSTTKRDILTLKDAEHLCSHLGLYNDWKNEQLHNENISEPEEEQFANEPESDTEHDDNTLPEEKVGAPNIKPLQNVSCGIQSLH